jgi:glutathione-regulated potassium-efflux system protein KefB
MQEAGLSMAMGAFLAGVMLSESTYRHQLEADVEPFRGILLGLFFLSVGMALDLRVIAQNLGLVAVSVLSLMVLKSLGIYLVARLGRASHAEAVERAVLMAQGGEFAFVLYGAAVAVGLLDAEENAILVAVIIVSMALTPLMVMLHDRLAPRTGPSAEGLEVPEGLTGNALIIGFGRVGQIVSQPLLARGFEISMIETDPEMIEAAADFGFKVYYGDGTRLDILHAAGASEAGAVVVCVDDREAAVRIVELCKAEFPLVPVLARAFDRQEALRLVDAGVDWQIRETLLSSLALGEQTLRTLGVSAEEAAEVMEDVRTRDEMRFERELVGGIKAAHDLIRGNLPGWNPGASPQDPA